MQLITISACATKITFAQATVSNWAYGRSPAPSGFPAPLRAGRQLRYILAEVDDWISSRAAARPGQPQAAVAPARRRPGRPRKIERVGGAE